MTATPITVTGETFDKKVLRSEKPVLVDFWADWCPPCHRLAPVLEEFAAEKADELVVAKLNIDHDPELAERYGVESIPTLNLYRDGRSSTGSWGRRPSACWMRSSLIISEHRGRKGGA